MTIKTIRLNKEEETLVDRILFYYKKDFSSCVKELISEKLEDLQDMRFIEKIKEGKSGKDYLSGDEISGLLK
ncbi:MAG: hypothetical protein COW13_04275 [Candidatus Omnitrophica bacterium CG12_big_fil_rev_8_21_14_0_65_50_5]|nr:MAG: hypothetical protein COW13_04275 [Candidatus Omnitrophica bacterium CG12_big_fil_rev_8_21_14_0_65_50_5]